MILEALLIVSGLAIGSTAGWFGRKAKEPKPVIPPNPLASLVLPSPYAAQKGPYEVRVNGRVLYNGFDLQAAKDKFKTDDNIPTGCVLELYGHGNHIASRTVR